MCVFVCATNAAISTHDSSDIWCEILFGITLTFGLYKLNFIYSQPLTYIHTYSACLLSMHEFAWPVACFCVC